MTPARRLAFALAAPVVVTVIRLVWATCRIEVVGNDDGMKRLGGEGSPLILSFWHDSIVICAWYMRQLARYGLRVTYLVSPSADGELAVRMLQIIGAHAVRGSATRSGVKAIHGMYRAMVRQSASPVVVPDGPQGPPREAKLGSIMLAQLSGAPMVPVACAASSVWRLRTWDRLQIPKPFSRVTINVGELMRVPNEMTDEQRECERLRLEQRLEELTAAAESSRGIEGCTRRTAAKENRSEP